MRRSADAPPGYNRPGVHSAGKVFDLMLPLDQVAEGYRTMDEQRAIKVLLTV